MVEKHDPSDLAVMTFEMLKRMQTQLDRIEHDVRDLKIRASNVEMQLGQMQTTMGQVNARLDRFDDRIARIESRLDLVEDPKPAAE